MVVLPPRNFREDAIERIEDIRLRISELVERKFPVPVGDGAADRQAAARAKLQLRAEAVVLSRIVSQFIENDLRTGSGGRTWREAVANPRRPTGPRGSEGTIGVRPAALSIGSGAMRRLRIKAFLIATPRESRVSGGLPEYLLLQLALLRVDRAKIPHLVDAALVDLADLRGVIAFSVDSPSRQLASSS